MDLSSQMFTQMDGKVEVLQNQRRQEQQFDLTPMFGETWLYETAIFITVIKESRRVRLLVL